MRTALTLFFFTLAIGFLIFIKITSESTLAIYKFIGIKPCKSCHSVSVRGNQYNIWVNSKHSSATTLLKSEKAITYAKENNISSPEKNEFCLKCHTTAYGISSDHFESTFNPEDGIQCEECHNAGSEYAKYEIMISEKKFISKGGEPGKKMHCVKCHSPNLKNTGFNRCPFQKKNFNIESAFERIKHPI